MVKTANAQVKISANASYTNTDSFGINTTGAPTMSFTETLTSSDINKAYWVQTTSGSPSTINLSSFVDAFGATIGVTTLAGFYIKNISETQTLVIGGGSAPAFGSDQYTVSAGSMLAITSGFTIDGSAHNVVITPTGSLTYQLIFVGS